MDNVYFSAVIYWVHLLATVLWFGGMMTNIFVFMPTALKVLDPPNVGKLMGAIMKKFRGIVYTCLGTLFITGFLINSMQRNFPQTGDLKSLWMNASKFKHIAIAVLLLMVIYAFEILARKAGKLAAKGPSPELKKLQSQQKAIGFLSFIVSLVILFLTALMNSISAS